MNRIDKLFREKTRPVLSIYMTAGYPRLEDTVPVLEKLEASGVDLIEVGMPFSDPLADGPVIQASSMEALENGMSIKVLFEQLEGVRKRVSVPLVLMGYLNPVIQYGIDAFIRDASRLGIDGVILPDLPMEEYEEHYREKFEAAGLHFVMLISPQTSTERVRKIASLSRGFLYMVSSSSTTGVKMEIEENQLKYFERIADMKLDIPRVIGFGISDAGTFNRAVKYADGAIIGSAFVQTLSRKEGIGGLKAFITSIRS